MSSTAALLHAMISDTGKLLASNTVLVGVGIVLRALVLARIGMVAMDLLASQHTQH